MTFTIGFLMDSVAMTREVINGQASLGGSESAMLGLARALKRRGHDVRIFASKLDPNCNCPDQHGVVWHHLDDLPGFNRIVEFDVFVVLRSYPHLMQWQPQSRLTLLWHQDLLTQPKALMAVTWTVDRHVYVSDYQRQQYEDLLPELAGHGWVTKNGYDASLVPSGVVKHPSRIIHVSRPERGLKPLLQMWPALKQARPDATLALCRYQSMYDSEGSNVKATCEMYDRVVARVNEEIGGIEWLGHLGKADLYREIATAAVMWYPGIATFAETSCIAAIEAQANGTPFVGSYKGALPETVPSGVLVPGDAESDAYQQASVAAVLEMLDGCRSQSFAYRKRQQAGREHVTAYTYDAIAAEWDAFLEETFRTRYETQKPAILRALNHFDDMVVARHVAAELGDDATVSLCDWIARGEDQGPQDYADRALNPDVEMAYESREPDGRYHIAGGYFEACTTVLDVACGNGSFALCLAQRFPHIRIVGLDYAAGNIKVATAAAARLGLSDRVAFYEAAVWDLPSGVPATLPASVSEAIAGLTFDGCFVGEFIEHVANCSALVDHIETFLTPNALVVYTCPSGPFWELHNKDLPVKRGHVHHFCADDLSRIFSGKANFSMELMERGMSGRGRPIGHWCVSYRVDRGRVAGQRDLVHRAMTMRPLQRLSVGLIARNAELDLGKCLHFVYPIADEILIGDTGGSTDKTHEIAARYHATVIPLPDVSDHEDGFAGARNAVLERATGEWFLWIDTDELLVGGQNLHKYLQTAVYNGFAIHQNHLMLDAPMDFDEPVRIFRLGRGVRFYGCIHEQPGHDDGNGDITPALAIGDVSVAHLGYLTETVRRTKMLSRNLPLLKRDQVRFANRRLGKVLVLRDYYNIGMWYREQEDGLSESALKHFRAAVDLFAETFADPSDKYHHLARPFYEGALRALGIGFDMEIALGGVQGDMPSNRRAALKKVRVRSHDELSRLMQHELAKAREQMHPAPIKTDPFPSPEPVAA